MLDYLRAENAYTDPVMKSVKPFEEKLYSELVGRIKQDDASVPYRYKDYWYYTGFEAGKEISNPRPPQRQYGRSRASDLDVNQLAANKSFYQIASWRFSPDQEKVAYVEDTVGRRQ
jgi:oligopeptidase B